MEDKKENNFVSHSNVMVNRKIYFHGILQLVVLVSLFPTISALHSPCLSKTFFTVLMAVVLLFSGGGMMGFGMGFGVIIMVLFWGAIIWLVISLINAGTKKIRRNSWEGCGVREYQG